MVGDRFSQARHTHYGSDFCGTVRINFDFPICKQGTKKLGIILSCPDNAFYSRHFVEPENNCLEWFREFGLSSK